MKVKKLWRVMIVDILRDMVLKKQDLWHTFLSLFECILLKFHSNKSKTLSPDTCLQYLSWQWSLHYFISVTQFMTLDSWVSLFTTGHVRIIITHLHPIILNTSLHPPTHWQSQRLPAACNFAMTLELANQGSDGIHPHRKNKL